MSTFKTECLRICDQNPDGHWLTIIGQDSEQSFSYQQLVARIYDYCDFFQQQSLQQGDVVLIVLKESLDLFASFFAGIVFGALPAFSAYPSPKQSTTNFLDSIANLVRYNEVRLTIGYPEVVSLLKQHYPAMSPSFIDYFTHDSIPETGRNDLTRFPAAQQEAFLQFSSGTTGAKKGVKISVEALRNQIEAYGTFIHFDNSSKVVSWLPHYHDMGLIAGILMPFLRQVPIFMMSPFEWVMNPGMLLAAITRHRGSHVWLPNFALSHLARAIDDRHMPNFDLSSVRQLVSCSEPTLYESVTEFVQRFSQVGLRPEAVQSCYAMAENTFAISSTLSGPVQFLKVDPAKFAAKGLVVRKPGGKRVASVGLPLPNVEIKITDKHGKKLSEGLIGEIMIKSNCMLDGYHNNPEATQASMVDGWFKTGDLGFTLEGQLYIAGREKEIIVVGGENFYPQDIELILDRETGLIPGRNVAFGVEDPRLGTERIVVLAEIGEGAKFDPVQLKAKLFSQLNISVSEIYALPARSLYKSTAGKISRHLNKVAFAEGRFGTLFYKSQVEATGKPAPSTAVQESPPTSDSIRERLVALISDLLPGAERHNLSLDTPLMSSGLIDSFSFADLVLRLETAFQVKIPERLWQPANFETLSAIQELIHHCQLSDVDTSPGHDVEAVVRQRQSSLDALREMPTYVAHASFLERLINYYPFGGRAAVALGRLMGLHIGKDVDFQGRIRLKIAGSAANIILGDQVIVGRDVDLRNRENGKIHLHRRVKLDDSVRIVAARNGQVEIGEGTRIGYGTIINSGGNLKIGRFCLIGGYVNINSSTYATQRTQFLYQQPQVYGAIEIGDDVWLGAGASILMGTRLGEGVIVASNSVVSGDIPPFAICAGVPAKIVRYR